MKSSPFLVAFGISIGIHVAAVGILVVAGSLIRPAGVQHEEASITLTLTAAPLEAFTHSLSTPKTPPADVLPARVTAEPTETPDVPNASQPLEPPVVRETVVVPQTVIVVAPAAQTTLQPSAAAPVATARGDGSSPIPGHDSTTSQAKAELKARPNYLRNPEPVYPAAARRRGQQGVVILSVKVTAKGACDRVTVKESSGFLLLDEAALNAVRNWEFEPAKVGATPVDSEIEVPVRFELSR